MAVAPMPRRTGSRIVSNRNERGMVGAAMKKKTTCQEKTSAPPAAPSGVTSLHEADDEAADQLRDAGADRDWPMP